MTDKKMKIEYGEDKTVKDYVEYELYNNDGGSVECAGRNAENAQEALGRLCQILANKGVIDANDVHYVARGWKSSDNEYSS